MSNFIDYDPPTEPWVDVIHADDAIVVANKQSGLLSVPGRLDRYKDCLQFRLEETHGPLHVIHRLDMPTSGVIVFGRTLEAHKHISAQFRNRSVTKRYRAVVDGVMADNEGEIDLPLIRDWPNRPMQKVCFETGKPAQTHWRVIERGRDRTLVELTPITGRSHQLRVHLSEIGHPILGDPLYQIERVMDKAPRLLLHAEVLSFQHPGTDKPVEFRVPANFDPAPKTVESDVRTR